MLGWPFGLAGERSSFTCTVRDSSTTWLDLAVWLCRIVLGPAAWKAPQSVSKGLSYLDYGFLSLQSTSPRRLASIDAISPKQFRVSSSLRFRCFIRLSLLLPCSFCPCRLFGSPFLDEIWSFAWTLLKTTPYYRHSGYQPLLHAFAGLTGSTLKTLA